VESWVIFVAGTRRCALPVRVAIETMRPLPVRALGREQHGVLGVATIRGTTVPVVDVAALFGDRSTPRRFVTIRVAERVVALAVDDVVGVRRVAAWEALPKLFGDDKLVAAIARTDAELVLALDAARLIPAEVAA
jgi:chemotaxis signal transduction protein